jgi:uncharacterized membrane protein YcaP (DUF421 family)
MQIIVRASIMFLFLWIVMRTMGRKELAEISPFELVLLVVMGDLIQQGVTQQDNSLVGAMAAVATFVLWILLFSYASFRNKRLGKLLEGQPVILVNKGELVSKMLRFERLTMDDVKDAAREQGIGDLAQVALGVLEPDGKFSFVRFDDRRSRQPDEHKT